MQITAALTYAPDAPFEIQEVELDEPRDDEILVRMVAAGICHTDLGVKAAWPADAGPLVLGHEGAGVVEAVGAGVSGLAAGDHVLLSYRSCRSCASCTAGHVSYCERFRELNAVGVRPDGSTTMRRDGAAVHGNFFGQSSFATHALAYASNSVKVDDSVDLTVAAPLGCGIQTGAGAVLNVLEPTRRLVVRRLRRRRRRARGPDGRRPPRGRHGDRGRPGGEPPGARSRARGHPRARPARGRRRRRDPRRHRRRGRLPPSTPPASRP